MAPAAEVPGAVEVPGAAVDAKRDQQNGPSGHSTSMDPS